MKEPEKIELSTGVVLKITGAPLHAMDAVRRSLEAQRPQVPKTYIEAKAREVRNPDDPDYQAALLRFEDAVAQKVYDAAVMLGTEIESVPDGMERPEADGWVAMVADIGIGEEIPERPRPRYLAWVKWVAAPTVEDNATLINAVERKMGVTEEGVAEAAALFRSRTERRADRKNRS